LQEDNVAKSQYYYEWSQVVFAQKGFQRVRELANLALKANPANGKAYLAIGKAYAADAQNIGQEQVEHNATYWAAVDKFMKAKQVDPSCEAEANDLINTYKKHFPNKEEAFMFGIQEGSSVTVGGWINEKTTARF
jgi:tetratricopeptide (TPR) repeat protein